MEDGGGARVGDAGSDCAWGVSAAVNGEEVRESVRILGCGGMIVKSRRLVCWHFFVQVISRWSCYVGRIIHSLRTTVAKRGGSNKTMLTRPSKKKEPENGFAIWMVSKRSCYHFGTVSLPEYINPIDGRVSMVF